jgi:hypothetical protein
MSDNFLKHTDPVSYSLLLNAIMANPSYAPDTGSDVFSYHDFERIGTLSFTQLAELRHRGAFSTVAHTFTSCCQRCSKSKDPEIRALPEIWYHVRPFPRVIL